MDAFLDTMIIQDKVARTISILIKKLYKPQ